jgi:hypothetical protein
VLFRDFLKEIIFISSKLVAWLQSLALLFLFCGRLNEWETSTKVPSFGSWRFCTGMTFFLPLRVLTRQIFGGRARKRVYYRFLLSFLWGVTAK